MLEPDDKTTDGGGYGAKVQQPSRTIPIHVLENPWPLRFQSDHRRCFCFVVERRSFREKGTTDVGGWQAETILEPRR